MTGGVVYQHLSPELGFDRAALQRRLAKGAKVGIAQLEESDAPQIRELLGYYADALEQTDQYEVAERIRALMPDQVLSRRFVKVVPDLK
jgi:glutamate synthase (NADPH/NADH) large chain